MGMAGIGISWTPLPETQEQSRGVWLYQAGTVARHPPDA
jgi:hypothetical protein